MGNHSLQLVFLPDMFFLLELKWWQQLEQLDHWLFAKLNSGLTNPVFDFLMPILRHGTYWAPLYLFFGVFAFLNYQKKGGWWIIFFLATVALTDMTGTYVFKHNFERLRPCSPDLGFPVRLLLKQCAGGYSFISNHAANHFGMATFFFITLRPILKKWAWISFLWAGSIAYAQIYVGVHFPSDILAGMLVGILVGMLTGKLFNKRYGFTIFDNQPTISS
jgi:undecaprenyl-diphosphatase